MLQEMAEFKQARVVLPPQAAGAAERGDAAFHRDACTREGGQVRRGADETGAFAGCCLAIDGTVNTQHGCRKGARFGYLGSRVGRRLVGRTTGRLAGKAYCHEDG